MQADPDAVDLLVIVDPHEQLRYKALSLLEVAIEEVAHVNVKGVKCNVCDGTPNQHKQQLLRLLRRLRTRFHRTTSSEGGDHFREDIEQLLLDLQQVLQAGIANCFHVEYIKWDAKHGATQNLFTSH